MSKKVPVVIKRNSTECNPCAVSSPTSQDLARKQILEIINFTLKKLVLYPEETEAAFQIGERTTIYLIKTIKADFGRILGSGGKNISSLRTLVAAMAANQGLRAIVQIANEEDYFFTNKGDSKED